MWDEFLLSDTDLYICCIQNPCIWTLLEMDPNSVFTALAMLRSLVVEAGVCDLKEREPAGD